MTGRILTVDAMHTPREFCRRVRELQGDDIVIVKNNQPTVREDLEDFFEDRQAERRTWQSDVQVEKGHGRLERRQVWTSPDMNDWFAKEWRDVAQVFRLQREVRTLKTGEVPQMLATLNNVVLALMEMLAVSNVAAKMREFAAFPEQALRLLLSGSEN